MVKDAVSFVFGLYIFERLFDRFDNRELMPLLSPNFLFFFVVFHVVIFVTIDVAPSTHTLSVAVILVILEDPVLIIDLRC